MTAQSYAQEYIDSYYVDTRNDHTRYSSLSDKITVETCVVGGGLAGLGTALPLAQQNHEVALIEATRIGFGASGRNGGQVIYGWAAEMSSLEKEVGLTSAQALWHMGMEAISLVDQRINHYHIPCDWHRGYAHVAIKPRHLHELQSWQHEAAQKYDYHGYRFWDKHQLMSQLASERYIGALYDEDAGHLHPLNYTLGLARAYQQEGGLIFEHSPMLNITKQAQGYCITTASGYIYCKNLVLAVNTFIHNLRIPLLQSLSDTTLPVGTYIIATEPLGQQAQQLIANNMAVCDTRFVLDYYRLSADQRLLFGGKVNYTGCEPTKTQLIHMMKQDMLKVFPQLSSTKIDYAWGGDVDISMSRAPHFGRLNEHIYFLQGFSGHGVAAAGLGGLVVAESILGDDRRLRIFEQLHHRRFPGGRYLRMPYQLIGLGYHKLKDLL